MSGYSRGYSMWAVIFNAVLQIKLQTVNESAFKHTFAEFKCILQVENKEIVTEATDGLPNRIIIMIKQNLRNVNNIKSSFSEQKQLKETLRTTQSKTFKQLKQNIKSLLFVLNIKKPKRQQHTLRCGTEYVVLVTSVLP